MTGAKPAKFAAEFPQNHDEKTRVLFSWVVHPEYTWISFVVQVASQSFAITISEYLQFKVSISRSRSSVR